MASVASLGRLGMIGGTEADQKAVIELLGKQRGVHVSLLQKDVPHGRYLSIEFRDGSSRATIVLDQGFGAWRRPGSFCSVRFAADIAA